MAVRKSAIVVDESEPQDIQKTAETVVKQKRHRNRPDLKNFGQEYVEPGDNARYLRYALTAFEQPPIDIADPKQVEKRISEYFAFCLDNDKKPNIKELGNWLGVPTETVRRWRQGDYRTETHCALIKKAVDIMESLWWDYAQNGKMNPAALIFIGKNAYGMKDVQDVVVTPNNPLQELGDAEAEKRMIEALPDDV